MRNISDKSCRETQNTHFMFSNLSFKNRAVYEIMWKNMVHPGRPQMLKWRMRFACWIPNSTDKHPEYVILKCFPAAITVTRTRLDVTLYVLLISITLKAKTRNKTVNFDHTIELWVTKRRKKKHHTSHFTRGCLYCP